jgi:hypothetical protein
MKNPKIVDEMLKTMINQYLIKKLQKNNMKIFGQSYLGKVIRGIKSSLKRFLLPIPQSK